MKALLKNYRQSPRKVRLVTELIKGQTVARAYVLLDHTPKRATDQIKKLIASAVANARQEGSVNEEDLVISDIRVDEGSTLKRYRPVSRGRAHPVRKRTSRISVVLEKRAQSQKLKAKIQK